MPVGEDRWIDVAAPPGEGPRGVATVFQGAEAGEGAPTGTRRGYVDAQRAVHGHEPRFRGRHRGGCHARTRRNSHFWESKLMFDPALSSGREDADKPRG